MNDESFECQNRRAEIIGNRVVFLRMSGNVRRSKVPLWFVEDDDIKRLRRLARRWTRQAKLGEPVLH